MNCIGIKENFIINAHFRFISTLLKVYFLINIY